MACLLGSKEGSCSEIVAVEGTSQARPHNCHGGSEVAEITLDTFQSLKLESLAVYSSVTYLQLRHAWTSNSSLRLPSYLSRDP
jgi:hypothetical protein